MKDEGEGRREDGDRGGRKRARKEGRKTEGPGTREGKGRSFSDVERDLWQSLPWTVRQNKDRSAASLLRQGS